MRNKVKLIEGFSGYKENVICYNTGASRGDRYGFDSQMMGNLAIRSFYERVLLGESFPNKMILGGLDLEGIIAASLFSHPEMILENQCSPFISSVEMVLKWGDVGFSHIPENHKDIIISLQKIISPKEKYNTKGEKENALKQGVKTIKKYILEGRLPPLQDFSENYEEITSTGEFIAYKSKNPLFHEIYSKGYLSGMWISSEDSNSISIYKKSQLVDTIDLNKVGEELDQMEKDLPKSSSWLNSERKEDRTFIHSPKKGGKSYTSLEYEEILEKILV